MNVVRHYHESVQRITLTIKVPQRPGDDSCRARVAQHATAVAFVEPRIKALAEANAIVLFGTPIPRFGVVLEPGFHFVAPLGQEIRGHRVAEAEGDEVGRAGLA